MVFFVIYRLVVCMTRGVFNEMRGRVKSKLGFLDLRFRKLYHDLSPDLDIIRRFTLDFKEMRIPRVSGETLHLVIVTKSIADNNKGKYHINNVILLSAVCLCV